MPVRVPNVAAVLRPVPGLAGGFALAVLVAVLLDGAGVQCPGAPADVRWVELAAVAGVPLAAVACRRRGGVAAWSTPLDGHIAAMLAVLLLAGLPTLAHGADVGSFRLVLAALASFYVLSALVAGDAEASESAWRVFPAAVTVMGLQALWSATTGLRNLAADAAAVDALWGVRGGLQFALAYATLLTLGRALEPGVTPAWRLAAVVGVTGVGLHLAATGLPFGPQPLVRLEAPLQFSIALVLALLLHRLGRTAWSLLRARRREAPRWWGVIAGNSLLGAWLLFGSGHPGLGLVLLGALAAALVAAAPAMPTLRPVPASAERQPELRRAA